MKSLNTQRRMMAAEAEKALLKVSSEMDGK